MVVVSKNVISENWISTIAQTRSGEDSRIDVKLDWTTIPNPKLYTLTHSIFSTEALAKDRSFAM
ncbi:hypothetical protein PIB30_047027 [Stylosanthes scabra]|uniref:Uncharacterized protein n=1 Tax=Stylosanthes scabra TaxID=79078 RepID=A0ABU6QG84_9FABA|nr:hypothetical protein [Stylosanthes scabra]